MSGCHNPETFKNNCVHGITLALFPCYLCNLSKRIDELEKSILETRIQFIGQIDKNRPYKCPVCDGKIKIQGQQFSSNYQSTTFYDCLSCEGKGIVWG